jgi:hypothetical protein
MICWLILLLRLVLTGLKSRRNLLLENLALRHQLLVLRRNSNRPRLRPMDRALLVWLSRAWRGWKIWLCLVQPRTVIRWHRAGDGIYGLEFQRRAQALERVLKIGGVLFSRQRPYGEARRRRLLCAPAHNHDSGN